MLNKQTSKITKTAKTSKISRMQIRAKIKPALSSTCTDRIITQENKGISSNLLRDQGPA